MWPKGLLLLVEVVLPSLELYFCQKGFFIFLMLAPYLFNFAEQGNYKDTSFPAVRHPCSCEETVEERLA